MSGSPSLLSLRMMLPSFSINVVSCKRAARSGDAQSLGPGSVEGNDPRNVARGLAPADHIVSTHVLLGGLGVVSLPLMRAIISCPIRSSFFASDFASRIAVFGCILFSSIVITAVEENMQHWPCLFSASTTSASKKCVVALRYPYARRAFPDFPISRFPDF